jgi:ATP-dependent Lon protease
MPRKGREENSWYTRLPLLPLKDVVVFPRMVLPLMVGRPASMSAVEESLASDRPLFVCTQIDPAAEAPTEEGLHSVGVAANILQTVRMPDGSIKIVVEGLYRASVRRVTSREGCQEVAVEEIHSKPAQDKKSIALMRTTLGQFEEYVRLSQRVAPEIVLSLRNINEAEALIDLVCAFFPVRVEERQEILAIEDNRERMEKISGFLMRENELLEIEKKVRERVREQMERSQREYYLHEQLKAIHQELGSTEEGGDEFTELRESITQAGMPKEVEEKAQRELGRYQRMPQMSPEGAVIRTYIEWLIDVPWKKHTNDALDIPLAKTILDEDHYGLAKVKERILEFLAVRKLSKHTKGPILCLVGPPGVGKTSLGQSVARAMKRKFVRMSLGGIRDEAEIRGHRRTYVGSLPGRIIQNMKKAGVRNPVFMLDEVDKMSTDFRGDPASALLEVLDPEQNKAFNDHYLEVDFDLHEVFFITTANDEYAIPHALHDRMEVVRLPGYTSHEKHHIARLFLVPKQMKECGLTGEFLCFEDSGIKILIERYTREAGVRELERQIANVCRKVARKVVEEKPDGPIIVDEKKPLELLGPYEYSEIRAELEPQIGVAVGMAWTMAGGDTLSIETTVMKGKGALTLTGQLGDVMKESARAAYSYLRSHAEELHIPPGFYRTSDLHVHVPEGAIPKDGPSAGIPIAVSMLSALKNTAPKDARAMTGEITLRGRILAVGGIKEKVLAAHRAGIRSIIMPKENEKDFVDIPADIREEIAFILVKDIAEVFTLVFD